MRKLVQLLMQRRPQLLAHLPIQPLVCLLFQQPVPMPAQERRLSHQAPRMPRQTPPPAHGVAPTPA